MGRWITYSFDALEHVPKTYVHRDDFIAAFTGRGFSMALTRWLAMNLEPATMADGSDGVVLRVDTVVLREMLADYLANDLWDVVEDPKATTRVMLIVAGRSTVYDGTDRARAEAAARASGGRVTVETLANAGHWVHVDDPAGVEDAVISTLDG